MPIRWIFIYLLLLLAPAIVYGQDIKFTALLIYNFSKYVEWAAENPEFPITILGDDPVVDELKIIAGKETERSLHIAKVASLDQVPAGGILYITPEKSNQLAAAMSKFGTAQVLIVTNKKGLGRAGAAINLITIDGKLRFEINPETFKKNGLKVKPVLFKLGVTLEN